MSAWLYAAYERRLVRELSGKRMPKHVAIMLDGNRRWARELGESATFGHRAGAERIAEVLGWCEDAGIEVVTLWLLSTDNLSRAAEEVGPLLTIICETVENLARSGRFRLVAVGNLDHLGAEYAQRLRAAAASTEACSGLHVNIAVGYGGRQEITDAVRSYLRDEAAAGRSLAEVADDFSLA
ncbi:MAG: polyprenyl diphosphate synthase, partial [Actinotignum timonense]|uniref:polyprenyl diphosphate synthase n=1 Tax=Actinotignum timonense TaxID=1870995 RepID=UPI00254CDF69